MLECPQPIFVSHSMQKTIAASLITLALAGCAHYTGEGLSEGRSSEADVLQAMGEPAMRWNLPDGRKQLAYPRGPAGYHTFMVYLDSAGHFQRRVNVLEPETMALIREGMSEAQVLQLIGPPQPHWTMHFPRRSEVALEWRFCDDWGEASRFDVILDENTRTVRTAYARSESSFVMNRGDLCSR